MDRARAQPSPKVSPGCRSPLTQQHRYQHSPWSFPALLCLELRLYPRQVWKYWKHCFLSTLGTPRVYSEAGGAFSSCEHVSPDGTNTWQTGKPFLWFQLNGIHILRGRKNTCGQLSPSCLVCVTSERTVLFLQTTVRPSVCGLHDYLVAGPQNCGYTEVWCFCFLEQLYHVKIMACFTTNEKKIRYDDVWRLLIWFYCCSCFARKHTESII